MNRTLLAAALLSGCVTELEPATLPADAPLATPPSFTLEATPFIADSSATFTVSDAPPGELVRLAWSTQGLGDGMCPAAFGGSCLGILSPAAPLPFSLLTNTAGNASLTINLPTSISLRYLALQAIILDRPALVSNPVAGTVLPVGTVIAPNGDSDGDGYTVNQGDCDDFNPSFNPGATDPVGDGFDTNCDGFDGADLDGDGEPAGVDCDDSDPSIHSAALELCDGIDQDCDGQIDQGACGLSEHFTVVPDTVPADVLLVIDDSCSMQTTQSVISDSTAAFIDPLVNAGVDLQVGIITTDTDDPSKSGRLQAQVAPRFLPSGSSLTMARSWFTTNTLVGTNGSATETGRRAADLALSRPLVNNYNAGFLRSDADLHIVFVSDELDQSGSDPTLSSFFVTYDNLKAAPYEVTVHSIAGITSSCSGVIAVDYLQISQLFGGFAGSICGDVFDHLDAIANIILGSNSLVYAFHLANLADPSTIQVELTVAGVGTFTLSPSQWAYDAASGTLELVGITPAAGTTVTVTYDR